MTDKVKDTDRGWKAIKSALKGTGQYGVVGVLGNNDARGDEFSNVQIATVHEFGLPERGIPERSFIRATVDAGAARYRKLLKQLLEKLVERKGKGEGIPQALRLLGEQMRADIIARINAGIEPPNAPATIAAKGSSTPLIDTGQLKQSISYEVRR
jgi:hypothetical protein